MVSPHVHPDGRWLLENGSNEIHPVTRFRFSQLLHYTSLQLPVSFALRFPLIEYPEGKPQGGAWGEAEGGGSDTPWIQQ
jgi:hypothetical protein